MFQGSRDIDFIITIGGKDVTQYVLGWEVLDAEKGMSRISVELANPDMVLSGSINEWDELAIRFGYVGELTGQAQFPIVEYKESYPTGKGMTVAVTAYDPTANLAGDKLKGKTDKKSSKDVIQDIAGANEIKAVLAGDSAEFEKMNIYIMNENPHQVIKKLGSTIKKDKGKKGKGGGKAPGSGKIGKYSSGGVKPIGAGKSGTGRHNRLKGKTKNLDDPRLGNSASSAQGEPITASLDLIGYPSLRAKTCITITNVGSKASGTYYVQQVTHKYRGGGSGTGGKGRAGGRESGGGGGPGHGSHGYSGGGGGGFHTSASLIRSGTGKGGAGDEQPTVMYGEVYNKNEMYLGPRKTDQESGETFEYGTGGPIIDFQFSTQIQLNRGASKGKVESTNLRKRAKPTATTSDDTGDTEEIETEEATE